MKDTLSYGSGWCWDDDNDRLTPLLVDKKDQFMSIMMQEMRARGIQLSVTLARGRLPQGCTEIYRYNSSIDKVLLRMMKQSDNLYAESMFYQVAKGNSPRTATASDASGAAKRLAMRLGLDPINYTIADGSGLSLYNYVSAEMIVALLRHAYQNREIYDHLYPSLPIAGVDGTAAELRVDFLNPAGSKTGKLLPTGNVKDVLDIPGFRHRNEGNGAS
jgi:D-alanyl-D-alanine carboxypeptidase/D-alanyl-D-alanine-endopeptidase (penicillin-binding protein 4)